MRHYCIIDNDGLQVSILSKDNNKLCEWTHEGLCFCHDCDYTVILGDVRVEIKAGNTHLIPWNEFVYVNNNDTYDVCDIAVEFPYDVMRFRIRSYHDFESWRQVAIATACPSVWISYYACEIEALNVLAADLSLDDVCADIDVIYRVECREALREFLVSWQQRRMDLCYEAMFSETVYDGMSKDRKKLLQKALKSVYEDVYGQ